MSRLLTVSIVTVVLMSSSSAFAQLSHSPIKAKTAPTPFFMDADYVRTSCATALQELPTLQEIAYHRVVSERAVLQDIRAVLETCAKAKNWAAAEQAVASLDMLSARLESDPGLFTSRGDTTTVFQQQQGSECGDGPSYPPGASCTLRCKAEREWCLCKDCVGIDCSSWPCFSCVNCNLTQAACVADCILSEPPPPVRPTLPMLPTPPKSRTPIRPAMSFK